MDIKRITKRVGQVRNKFIKTGYFELVKAGLVLSFGTLICVFINRTTREEREESINRTIEPRLDHTSEPVNKIDNFVYEENSNKHFLKVNGKKAILPKGKMIEIFEAKAEFQCESLPMKLSSKKCLIDQKTNKVFMNDCVFCMQNGTTIRTESAVIDIKSRSREQTSLHKEFQEQYQSKQQKSSLVCEGHNDKKQAHDAVQKEIDSGRCKTNSALKSDGSNCVITAKSGELQIFSKDQVCKFSGNTSVVCENRARKYKFSAESITVYCQNKFTIMKVIAKKNVVFECDGSKITAESCVFEKDVAEFKGNVLIQDEKRGNIKADSASYDTSTKIINISSSNKVKANVYEIKNLQSK
jgi:lipopolysaccharide export system protein LptA